MYWIVFGDDWKKNPSTTQHLIRNLPQEDQILWINSIGMRSPKFKSSDLKRFLSKGRSILLHTRGGMSEENTRQNVEICNGRILPWHLSRSVSCLSSLLFKHQIKTKLKDNDGNLPIVLSANPVAVNYLDFEYGKLIYLRLDDYEKLPGVDPKLIRFTESKMMKKADYIFGTAVSLLPTNEFSEKSYYLPQGVDWEHFATASTVVPSSKTLGFFGLLEEWLDFDLIEKVAAACPDWTLEFIGSVRCCPSKFRQIRNIRVKDPVPYEELPRAVENWRAAWIPFKINRLTKAVNPLKLREYLSAGFPTLCTPLPEAETLKPSVNIVANALDVKVALAEIEDGDTEAERGKRRLEMRSHSWASRIEIVNSKINAVC